MALKEKEKVSEMILYLKNSITFLEEDIGDGELNNLRIKIRGDFSELFTSCNIHKRKCC